MKKNLTVKKKPSILKDDVGLSDAVLVDVGAVVAKTIVDLFKSNQKNEKQEEPMRETLLDNKNLNSMYQMDLKGMSQNTPTVMLSEENAFKNITSFMPGSENWSKMIKIKEESQDPTNAFKTPVVENGVENTECKECNFIHAKVVKKSNYDDPLNKSIQEIQKETDDEIMLKLEADPEIMKPKQPKEITIESKILDLEKQLADAKLEQELAIKQKWIDNKPEIYKVLEDLVLRLDEQIMAANLELNKVLDAHNSGKRDTVFLTVHDLELYHKHFFSQLLKMVQTHSATYVELIAKIPEKKNALGQGLESLFGTDYKSGNKDAGAGKDKFKTLFENYPKKEPVPFMFKEKTSNDDGYDFNRGHSYNAGKIKEEQSPEFTLANKIIKAQNAITTKSLEPSEMSTEESNYWKSLENKAYAS